jgi:peroxiredoxin
MLAKGDKAPTFRAPSTEGEFDLAAILAERPAVLYFFPKAFTSG